MSPSPVPAMSPVPELTGAGDKRQPQPRSRRSSNVSLGRRSRLSSEVGDAIGEKVQVIFDEELLIANLLNSHRILIYY